MQKHRRLLAVAIGGLWLVAGCSHSPKLSPNASAGAGAPSEQGLVRELQDLPLTQLLTLTPSDDRTIFDAVEASVGECMKAQGFDYPSRPYVEPSIEITEPRPYGVWRMDEAANRGYHGPVFPPSIDSTDRWLQSLPSARRDAAVRALSGLSPNAPPGTPPSESGCEQRAQRSITQQNGAAFEAARTKVEDLGNLATSRTEASLPVKKALVQWSGCMKAHGYTFASPAAAASGFGGDSISSKEISQAVQDVRCKDSAHVMDLYFKVQSSSEQAIFAKNQDVALAFKAMRTAELKGAGAAQ